LSQVKGHVQRLMTFFEKKKAISTEQTFSHTRPGWLWAGHSYARFPRTCPVFQTFRNTRKKGRHREQSFPCSSTARSTQASDGRKPSIGTKPVGWKRRELGPRPATIPETRYKLRSKAAAQGLSCLVRDRAPGRAGRPCCSRPRRFSRPSQPLFAKGVGWHRETGGSVGGGRGPSMFSLARRHTARSGSV